MTLGDLIAALLGWLGDFVQFVFSFVPRIRVVRCDQLAVRCVGGDAATRVDPGIHWYWPWCTEIEAVYASRQSILVPPITVETKDGERVAVGCAVVYRIVDPIRYRIENFDADSNMGEVAMAGLREIVNSHSLAELSASAQEDTRLGSKLARRMGKDLDSFGVEVLACRPTDHVRLDRALRVFGMSSHTSITTS